MDREGLHASFCSVRAKLMRSRTTVVGRSPPGSDRLLCGRLRAHKYHHRYSSSQLSLVGRFLPLSEALRQHTMMLQCMRQESARSGRSHGGGKRLLCGFFLTAGFLGGRPSAWEAVSLPPATSRLCGCRVSSQCWDEFPPQMAPERAVRLTRRRSNGLLGNDFCTERVPLCKNR